MANNLTKVVNGISVPMTDAEATAMQNEWTTNATNMSQTAYIRARKQQYPPFVAIVSALVDWAMKQNTATLPTSLQNIISQINSVNSANPPPAGTSASTTSMTSN